MLKAGGCLPTTQYSKLITPATVPKAGRQDSKLGTVHCPLSAVYCILSPCLEKEITNQKTEKATGQIVIQT